MKETRASIALLIFIVIVHIAHLLPQTNSITEVTQSYPSTVCPGAVGDSRATALLPNKSLEVRAINRPEAQLRRNNQGSFPMNNGAILLSGSPTTTNQIQTKAGRWTAALSCIASNQTSWFVGGTANVTSQSKLVLVNSGLSDAIVDVTSFSENGPVASVPVTVKPSSEKVIRVDSLDPGANRVVLKVETRSGRVVSYLLDERIRGLNNIGADFVAPFPKAETDLTIAALPVKLGGSNNIKHTLRIMTTGKVDATASVEVVSPEGVFIPVGYGNITLAPQEVREIDISEIDLGDRTFGLKISATQPVVAAVFSQVRAGSVSDFMWSTPSLGFGTVTFNLYGLEPTFSFVGEKVLVNVSWRNNQGKNLSKTLIGDEVLNWKAPVGVRSITLINQSGVRAGMNWLSRDGVTRISLSPSSNLESAAEPVADVSVIQSRN